jgi:putative transposase
MPDSRRASHAGPRAHLYHHTPKRQVASVIGFLKGKSAIAIARMCGKKRNFSGEHFWARGYAVSTVGFELEQFANTSASKNSRMATQDSL